MEEEWWQSNLRALETASKREEALSSMYTNINKH